MWIGGRRRGGAKDLSNHLQKTDENEAVHIREIEGFSSNDLTGANLEQAIKQMEAVGYGKGDKRNLFHTIIAPAYGETLTPEQRDFVVRDYAEKMGFRDHQRVVVEHWKNGKQHFHLVFNIIDPMTGKTHELKWTKRKEWGISRGLEKSLGLSTPVIKGKSAKPSHMQRGKRSGVDPRKIRKDITSIYTASKTTQEFVSNLERAGYALTRGRRNQLVLVDKLGNTYGLMRQIEGKKLTELRQKFPELGKMRFRPHAELVKARKPARAVRIKIERPFIHPRHVRANVRKAYRTSRSGAAFNKMLNRHGYVLGRGKKGYSLISRHGERYELGSLLGLEAAKRLDATFPDLVGLPLRPVSDILRRLKANPYNKTARVIDRAVKTYAILKAKRFRTTKKSPRQKSTYGAFYSAKVMRALFAKVSRWIKDWQEKRQYEMPLRPIGHGGMSKAQLTDLKAAMDGKITWAEYFQKWGSGGPSL